MVCPLLLCQVPFRPFRFQTVSGFTGKACGGSTANACTCLLPGPTLRTTLGLHVHYRMVAVACACPWSLALLVSYDARTNMDNIMLSMLVLTSHGHCATACMQ